VSGQLKYFWDDLCCCGRAKEKLHEHVVVETFPGVSRCPRKDGFHGCQLVTSTFNSGTGEVDVFSRQVGETLRPSLAKDVSIAAKHVEKADKLGPVEARRVALKRYRGTGIIRTFGPTPEDLLGPWKELIGDFRRDRELKGSKSIVRSQYGNLSGTIEQMESMIDCINKGCYSDPMKVKHMYSNLRRHSDNPQLIYRLKKSESVKNETVHKGANRLVHSVSRMGEDMMDIRIDFFVAIHNLKLDIKLGRIDASVLGLPHEAMMLNRLASSVLETSPFPLAQRLKLGAGIDSSSDIYEPHGFEYYKFVREKKAAEKTAAARKTAQQQSASETGASSSTGAASSSSTARSPVAGKRATAARKGRTQNLLNAEPVAPARANEIELVLKCVANAGKQKKRKKECGTSPLSSTAKHSSRIAQSQRRVAFSSVVLSPQR